ncbi:MAG: hypothetical protein ACPLXA_07610 [Moorellaceae bacterium]
MGLFPVSDGTTDTGAAGGFVAILVAGEGYFVWQGEAAQKRGQERFLPWEREENYACAVL